MNSKTLALFSGAACIAVLATYAWAASHEAKKEVTTEDAAAKVEESAEAAEPARLCIPMAEANEAAATEEATDASAEDSTEAKTEEATEEVKTEDVAAEVALPVCDEDGNPPAAEATDGEAATEEATTEEAMTEEAAEEPAKTE